MNNLTPEYNAKQIVTSLQRDESDCIYILTGVKGLMSRTAEFTERVTGGWERNWEHRFSDGHILFSRARNANELKSYIEEELRSFVHRDNEFFKIESLEDLLASPIYRLNRSPRILKLPENSVSAIEKVNSKQPRALEFLGSRVIGLFLGSSYSLDWQYMTGVGERRSFQLMHDNLPHACRAIFGEGYDPQNMSNMRIRCTDERAIGWNFVAGLKDEDIPALIKVIETPGTEYYTAHLIAGNWEHFAGDYEGLSYNNLYTNIDDTPKSIWNQTDILTDWAIENSVKVGTVENFVKAKAVRWPGDKTADEPLMKRLVKAARNAFREKTESETYWEENARIFNEGLNAIKARLNIKTPHQSFSRFLPR